jgi:hypothetical protein
LKAAGNKRKTTKQTIADKTWDERYLARPLKGEYKTITDYVAR